MQQSKDDIKVENIYLENSKTTDIIQKIHLALNEVRPYLIEDKGDIEFIRYEIENKVVVLRFLGNCVNCPMAIMTLRAGIERYILHYAPEVRRVEAIK